mmetsp:Transcript_10030/g.17587  ORF Transcript_10030/g.17587 Transcript_10030/m.17587 type:complete len:228 (+) Transcript_10030:827-1510(+)
MKRPPHPPIRKSLHLFQMSPRIPSLIQPTNINVYRHGTLSIHRVRVPQLQPQRIGLLPRHFVLKGTIEADAERAFNVGLLHGFFPYRLAFGPSLALLLVLRLLLTLGVEVASVLFGLDATEFPFLLLAAFFVGLGLFPSALSFELLFGHGFLAVVRFGFGVVFGNNVLLFFGALGWRWIRFFLGRRWTLLVGGVRGNRLLLFHLHLFFVHLTIPGGVLSRSSICECK